MKSLPCIRLFALGIGLLLASCGGGAGSSHFNLQVLVTPEDAKAVLGAEVGNVAVDGLGNLEDKGNRSWQSNCRYETTAAPKRMVRIQGYSWQVDQVQADSQFNSQREKFINIEQGSVSEKVEGLGTNAIAFKGNAKKDTGLLVQRGLLVLSMHVTGGAAPDDQVAKLKTLAEKILASVPAQ